jgi:hypothetical protein
VYYHEVLGLAVVVVADTIVDMLPEVKELENKPFVGWGLDNLGGYSLRDDTMDVYLKGRWERSSLGTYLYLVPLELNVEVSEVARVEDGSAPIRTEVRYYRYWVP